VPKPPKKREKKPIFTRGYKECRSKVNSGSKFVRSCFNCAYFYQEHGDTEEVCQNTDVIEYDMIVEGNTIYCLKWKPSAVSAEDPKSAFKRGRGVLD